MRQFNAYEKGAAVLAGATLAATTLAGCSGGGSTAPNRSPTPKVSSTAPARPEGPTASAACGTEGAPQASSETMRYTYEYAKGANKKLAGLQKEIGLAAVDVAIHSSFAIEIGGVACTVRLGIPQASVNRQQGIVFAENSVQAPEIFSELGITGEVSDTTSTTAYRIEKGPDGTYQEASPSVSVIGQETTGDGLFHNAATEFCQGLEVNDPRTDSSAEYAAIKEAECNGIGIAADSRQIGMSYPQYEYRMGQTGTILTPPANHGLLTHMPVLSQPQYNMLPAAA